MRRVGLASFPGLPCFLFFGLCSVVSSASVYYTEHKPKNKKWGKPGNEARWDDIAVKLVSFLIACGSRCMWVVV